MSNDNQHSLDVLHKIKSVLHEEKRIFNYPNPDIKIFEAIRILSEKKLLQGRSLERGFSAVGLVIADENVDFKNTVDEWYGYTIIKSKYYRELTWMMNFILKIVSRYFRGMEAREYLYDHISRKILESLKYNHINLVFKDVLDETERLIDEAIKFQKKENF